MCEESRAHIKLAVYVAELVGTEHNEEGYFRKWRLHDDRYVWIGSLPQTIEIATVTSDMSYRLRAAARQRQHPEANALDFFSPSVKPNGFFPRQVVLDGSLQVRVVAQDDEGHVLAESMFAWRLDARGPRMMEVLTPRS